MIGAIRRRVTCLQLPLVSVHLSCMQTQQAQQAARSSDPSLQAQQASRSWEEAGLTAVAVAIAVVIAALLVKKVVWTAGVASYQTGSFL